MKPAIQYLLLLCLVSHTIDGQFSEVRRSLDNDDMKRSSFVLDSVSRQKKFIDSVLYYRALVALKGENMNEAKKNSEKLKEEFPGFNAHYLNGLINFVKKDLAGSIDEFGKTLQDDPTNVKALYNRALALGLLEDFDSAIEDLSKCLSIHPKYVPALYSRAYWSELSGKFDQARTDYEQVITLDRRNYDAYLGLAHIYQLQKDPVKACEMINTAIAEGSQIAEDLKSNYCK
jgi:tetratricopeptide (TPR) repeat protein